MYSSLVQSTRTSLLVTGTVLSNIGIDELDVKSLGLGLAEVLDLLPLAEELLLLQMIRQYISKVPSE